MNYGVELEVGDTHNGGFLAHLTHQGKRVGNGRRFHTLCQIDLILSHWKSQHGLSRKQMDDLYEEMKKEAYSRSPAIG